MARPSKYTPERVEKILEFLRGGNTRNTSAQASGVHIDTFGDWIKRYPDFSDKVKEAEHAAEATHVANIATAASRGSWQASAWWLERRRHADWGKRDRIELVKSVEQLAVNAGVDSAVAVRQAEQILAEIRSAKRA